MCYGGSQGGKAAGGFQGELCTCWEWWGHCLTVIGQRLWAGSWKDRKKQNWLFKELALVAEHKVPQ